MRANVRNQRLPKAVRWIEGLGVTPPVIPSIRADGRASSPYVDVFDLARWDWDRKSIFSQPFDMECDGFADFGLDLRNAGAGCDAAGQVRDVRGVVAFCLLDDDRVAHITSRLETCLLEDAVQRAWREIVAWLTWNSDPTGLARVLVLAMTAPCGDEVPAICLDQPKHLADLHRRRIPARPGRRKPSRTRLRLPIDFGDRSQYIMTPNVAINRPAEGRSG